MEAERSARWAEAFRGQAERNLAEAEGRRKKAEVAVQAAERRTAEEKGSREKAEKMVEAYRLVLKDIGILEEGLRRDRIAGRCVELPDGTERREGTDGGNQQWAALLIL
ncbi:hypothetical protein A1Q1_00595 [Trichosporon asahii var. asahii CBS 2479]|uniref:Uncharacterized protein n=1 Tax=Trichosporon asahii var. asahii (strain ATCC 90039 / CBS 2479 / JCM 2466 / KCTC 7840 / NBRC 103889/ NCYC 2677 / UAMH 7654) TaxID=1186058 RepID=J5R0W6_TRIAS|nr:hypothetical protein A1Q1_00595 [Trichosporon asahii var. asahii CBS 2479]EJT50128.1 hypothetical protein A1Q1_00595 [Trichosporon asahii var. asahii CBS 2479]